VVHKEKVAQDSREVDKSPGNIIFVAEDVGGAGYIRKLHSL